MTLRLNLKRYLDRHGVTPYRLVQESRLAARTIYDMARKPAQRIDLDTLNRVMQSLERITGESVTPNDLLEVIEETKPKLVSLKPGEVGEATLKSTPARGKFKPRGPRIKTIDGSLVSDAVTQEREERATSLARGKR